MSKEAKSISYKAALKMEIAYQLENSLGKLKDLLGEKKFNARVKKAVKLITEGIKEEKKVAKETPANKPVKTEAVVAIVDAKANEKKSPVKVSAKKKTEEQKVATSDK